MICPHCGENNPDNAKYCSRCSATLPRRSKASGSGKSSGAGMDGKTIVIIILLVLLVIGAIVFIKSRGKGSSIEEVTEEATEEKTEEATEEETEEKTEEATEETSEEKADWTADNGLDVQMADKVSFKFNTMKYKSEEDEEDEGDEDSDESDSEDEDENATEEEFEVSAKLTISETTENAPDGYKIVKAAFVDDVSGSEGDSGILADGAFDRYTGTYFGFENGKPEQDGDDKADLDDFVRITNGNDHYDVTIMSEIDANGSSIKKTITVICPEDYDGTVFFAGYSSKELDEELKAIDLSTKLYTFDELPFMNDGHDMYYFNYQKTDSSGRSSWDEYEVQQETTQESSSEPEHREHRSN